MNARRIPWQRTLAACGACVALAAAGGAHAQTWNGLSVGASVGQSHWKSPSFGDFANDDRSDLAGKVYGSYQFTPYLGLEGGWAKLGAYHGSDGSLRGDALYLDAVGTMPLAYGFTGLAKLGVMSGRLRSEDLNGAVESDRGTGLTGGLGLQYDLSPQLAVRTEWERYRFDALDGRGSSDLYSVGLNYKF